VPGGPENAGGAAQPTAGKNAPLPAVNLEENPIAAARPDPSARAAPDGVTPRPKGDLVEVKIGVQNTSREITLESEQSPEEIEVAVSASFENSTPLRLVDHKGSIVLVPSSALAYVEIGAPRRGGVGFGMQ